MVNSFAPSRLISAEHGPPVVIGELMSKCVMSVLAESVRVLVVTKVKIDLNELIVVDKRILNIFGIKSNIDNTFKKNKRIFVLQSYSTEPSLVLTSMNALSLPEI